MNNLETLLNSLNEYIRANITFRELGQSFDEFFLDSDYEFTEKQAGILDDINEDIAFTATEPYTAEDKKIGLFTQDQLKEKIKNYLKDLAVKA